MLLLLAVAVGATGSEAAQARAESEVLQAWFNAQTNLQTWTAEFVQTRKLKSLTRPLTAQGRVWFSAPNRFRWQLDPEQTIAVRTAEGLLIFYPQLKRVERLNLSAAKGPWRDSLALLEAGFPRSKEQLEAQFQVISPKQRGRVFELSLRPRSTAARKMMPQIKIEFDAEDLLLLATELEFADGSSMRNDFKNTALNPDIDPAVFNPPIPSDYKVEEPLKSR